MMAEQKCGGYSVLEFVTVGWRCELHVFFAHGSVKGRCYYISQKSLRLFNAVYRQCLDRLCQK